MSKFWQTMFIFESFLLLVNVWTDGPLWLLGLIAVCFLITLSEFRKACKADDARARGTITYHYYQGER